MWKRSCLLALFMLVISSAAAQDQSCECIAELRTSLASQWEEFRVEPGGPIVVSGVANGMSGAWLLDTGASCCLLDRRHEFLLGNPVSVSRLHGTSGYSSSVNRYNAPTIAIGRTAMKVDRPVALLDMEPFSQLLGREIDGILGMPFIHNRVIVVDAQHGRVLIGESDDRPLEARGVAVPIDVGPRGCLYVTDAAAGGVPLRLMLDTGMSGAISLAKAEFQQLVDNGEIASLQTSTTRNVHGDTVIRTGLLRSFRLGPFLHSSIDVAESAPNRIGLQYLSRFTATIDADDRQLYLQPTESWDARDAEASSGLHLLWVSNRVMAVSVDEGSPADIAGMEKGDELLEVQGERVTGSVINSTRRLLTGNVGSEVVLAYRRRGTVRRAALVLTMQQNWMRDQQQPVSE